MFCYIGGRGVNFLQYSGIGGHRLHDLHSSRIYPDRPQRKGVYPSFSTPTYSYVVAYNLLCYIAVIMTYTVAYVLGPGDFG